MLSTHSTKFIALFFGLLLAGLFFGNMVVLVMSLVPLSLLLAGLLTEPPRHINACAGEIKSLIWLGDVVEISREVTVSDGFGIVTLFQELPPHFSLVEGNNLLVRWKNWGPRTFTFACKVRCAKRGHYVLPPVKWEARHALSLTQTHQGILGEPVELLVQPRILNLRRIRGVAGIATSPFPVIDVAKIGVATTDFREIRDYVRGDPVKNINWKATARQAAQGKLQPLVNEYEVEGKKSVWIFLDAASYLEVGTDIENSFEYCLEAANGVVYYFTDRGYRVGMYIYNDGDRLFYPDAGKKQFLRISRELINLNTAPRFDEFPRAIEKCRRYLLGYNPLCIIITRLDTKYNEDVIRGVTKLRLLRGRRRRKLPVLVISVSGYNVIPRLNEFDDNSALMLQLQSRPQTLQLRRMGASLLEWNPRKENFSTALLRQVKTK
ncbi:MAG: hypothetical protein A2Y90_00020 [Chloroflexi bacterium RBG_13_52_12]|nr:MAG: hypothetical protein A2Y90_00020 [Chloroflexi bacterium RBG_13_52_12]